MHVTALLINNWIVIKNTITDKIKSIIILKIIFLGFCLVVLCQHISFILFYFLVVINK